MELEWEKNADQPSQGWFVYIYVEVENQFFCSMNKEEE